ncbi:MAG: thiamine pyrophosphate-dependent dehydrogenase E1 component subunit alpha [Deltaproteobacteria bacterium]|nr:thiamine pyrophosphate-dependent dehydrogenase E1 component subunit alpha [Deltaproteobacteria bacterium]
MSPDLWSLYALMLKARLFEEATALLWHEGLISGELHLGTGEEAIIAGVVSHLKDDDAMALDHRGTAAMLMRGVDPVSLLREFLGSEKGLCHGMGGHMHLFSKEHLAASSGIVGAEGPAAAGFALAAQYLRPGSIAVAFFGDGAMNQGMLLESMNLAAVWKLPVLFVCKDDGWGITTKSDVSTAGNINERVRGLGVPALDMEGCDVAKTWEIAGEAINRIRREEGPVFLHTRCVHFEGHFLGFQLIRIVRDPLQEMPKVAAGLTKSMLRFNGAAVRERIAGLKNVIESVLSTLQDPRRDSTNDPLSHTRATLQMDQARLKQLEDKIKEEINNVLMTVLVEAPS